MRTSRLTIFRLVVLVCALVLGNLPAAPALAKAGKLFLPDMENANPLKATYAVTYQPNTVVIDDATMKLLTVGNAGATEFRFKPSATAAGKLKAGQIVIFSGLALRKISSVSVSKTAITVETATTTLDKAIRDGNVGFDYHVDWTQVPLASYQAMRAGPAGSEMHLDSISGFGADGLPVFSCDMSPCSAQTAAVPPVVSFSGKVQGWDVVMKLSPTASQLNIELTGKFVDGNSQTSVSGKGFIANFTQETFVTFEQSKLGEAVVRTTGLSGQMEIKWASAAPNGGFTTIFAFQIPLELPIPFQVGPVPIILKLKANLQIVPQLDVDTASSGGSWKATYRSDEGLQFQNNALTPSGSLQSAELNTSGETVSAGFGPVGFGLGVEFPRVEVSIFNVASAFISIKTYGTSIFLTEPPCQKGDLTLAAFAGFSLKFFGASVGTDPTKLWEQVIHKFKDDKHC